MVRGKNVPAERLAEVARHYELLGGVSPINAQIRALLVALVTELNAHGPQLPVYWGNRNWHPLLPEVVEQMAADGVRHVIAFVTSAFGSAPSCRQYLKASPTPGKRWEKRTQSTSWPGCSTITPPSSRRQATACGMPWKRCRPSVAEAQLIYTGPRGGFPIAAACRCSYQQQLAEACRLVSQRLNRPGGHLAYHSRSGPPDQPWLEPDVRDFVRAAAQRGNLPRRGGGADRGHLRAHRGHLRLGRGTPPGVRGVGDQPGAGGGGGQPSAFCPHDPRAGPGAGPSLVRRGRPGAARPGAGLVHARNDAFLSPAFSSFPLFAILAAGAVRKGAVAANFRLPRTNLWEDLPLTRRWAPGIYLLPSRRNLSSHQKSLSLGCFADAPSGRVAQLLDSKGEIVLKATATILSGWMALVLSLSTGGILAGSGGGELALLAGAMSVGQTDTAVSTTGDPRQQTADLLLRAAPGPWPKTTSTRPGR